MYSISTITPGNYSLIVTSLGYTKKTIPVEIKADQTLSINVTLEIKVYKEKEVLITASRSEKSLDEISVPVAIVDQEEIETTGSIRLTDILDEQIGMNVVSNHGTGIQVQGFDRSDKQDRKHRASWKQRNCRGFRKWSSTRTETPE